jgi:putative oxidoreductase
LQKLYSTFPGSIPGIGLLILRIVGGIATVVYGGIILTRLDPIVNGQFSYISHLILSLLLITGSIFFILGLMMPFISITLAVCEFGMAFNNLTSDNSLPDSKFGWVELFLLASIATALAFLGPGAFSIDARLFGRKRIFIPSSRKDVRSE